MIMYFLVYVKKINVSRVSRYYIGYSYCYNTYTLFL